MPFLRYPQPNQILVMSVALGAISRDDVPVLEAPTELSISISKKSNQEGIRLGRIYGNAQMF